MLIKPYIPSGSSKKSKKKSSSLSSTDSSTAPTKTNKLSIQPEENERDIYVKKTYENFYTEFPTLKEIYRNNKTNNNNNTNNTNNNNNTTPNTTNLNNSNGTSNNNNNNNNVNNNDKYFRKNLEGIKSKINQNFKEICEKEFCNCDSKFIACFCSAAKAKARSSPESQREMERLTEFKESFKDVQSNWKKRDILYYCFIQRDNEVSIIYEFIENICLYYRLSYKGGAMCDLGCGLGRMFTEWDSRSKFETIEAFEPDEDYFNFAYNYSKNTCNRVDVYKMGFLDINIFERYDMIVSIHGPLQYLTKLEDRILAMKKMYDALKPGGIVIIDLSNFMCGLSNIMNNKQQRMLINGSQVIRTSTIHTDTFNCNWFVDDIFYSVPDNGNNNDHDHNNSGTNSNRNEIEDNNVHYSNGHLMVEELTFAIISKSELQLLFISSGFINIKWSSQWDFNSFLFENGLKNSNSNIGSKNNQGARIIMIGQKPLQQ